MSTNEFLETLKDKSAEDQMRALIERTRETSEEFTNDADPVTHWVGQQWGATMQAVGTITIEEQPTILRQLLRHLGILACLTIRMDMKDNGVFGYIAKAMMEAFDREIAEMAIENNEGRPDGVTLQ